MRDTKGPKGSEWIPYDYALKMLLALRRIANHDIDYDGDNAQGLIDIAASAIKGLENVRPTGATFDDILRLAHLDVCASGNTEGEEEMTHLCDTCKYREEECKPRNARIVGGDVTECDGYEEDGACSA